MLKLWFQVLAFDIEGPDTESECQRWLSEHGAVIASSGNAIDTKSSSPLLKIPIAEDAVAHGDANMSLENFLSRSVARP